MGPVDPLSVVCPFCKAPIGERCVAVRDAPAPVKSHAWRRRAALAAAFVSEMAARRALLRRIGEGTDIRDQGEARLARRLERIGLIRIVAPIAILSEHEERPYFGVVLTDAGRAVLEENKYRKD